MASKITKMVSTPGKNEWLKGRVEVVNGTIAPLLPTLISAFPILFLNHVGVLATTSLFICRFQNTQLLGQTAPKN